MCSYFHYRNSKDNTFQNTRKNCDISKTGREWYWFSAKSGSRDEVAVQQSLDVLSKYFLTNETHAYGIPCLAKPKLSFHIRGGDIVRGDFTSSGSYEPKFVHPKYGPVPTSFYATLFGTLFKLDNELYTVKDPVVIFSEDLRNPSIIFFLKLRNIGYNITFRIGKPLLSDLHLLSCSENVAISYGSFWRAFSLREKPVLHIFKKECEGKSDYIYPLSAKFYTMSSAAERAKFTKQMKIWKNTGYQRHLVDKYYKVRGCSRLYSNSESLS